MAPQAPGEGSTPSECSYAAGVPSVGALNAFSSFSNNVWPIAPDTPYVPGGEMFVCSTMDATKYITGPQWDALSIVHGDQFRQVTATSPNLQVSVNGQMAGAVLPASWA